MHTPLRVLRRVAAVLAASTLLGTLFAVPAFAHSHYDHSSPAAGAMVQAVPATVSAVFTEETDPHQSSFMVFDAGGTRVDAGDGTVDLNDPDRKTMTVSLKSGLGNGIYTVRFRTFTADDGGIVDGVFRFGVNVAVPALEAVQQMEAGGDSGSQGCAAAVTTPPPGGGSRLLLEGLIASLPFPLCGSSMQMVLNYGPMESVDVGNLSPEQRAQLVPGMWAQVEAVRSGDTFVATQVQFVGTCTEQRDDRNSDGYHRCNPGAIHGTDNAEAAIAAAAGSGG